jgi:hypothetical protein
MVLQQPTITFWTGNLRSSLFALRERLFLDEQ